MQQCWLLRQVNEWQDYWYRCRCSNKYRPIPIATDIGDYRPIPYTGIGLTLLKSANRWASSSSIRIHYWMCRIYVSLLTFVRNDVYMSGPEFNLDSWLNEKFNLGLDFPNVSKIYILCVLFSVWYICTAGMVYGTEVHLFTRHTGPIHCTFKTSKD